MNTPPTPQELKAWRVARGLTQEQAARELSTTLRTFQRWEKGDTTPPAFLRAALSGADYWEGVELLDDAGPPDA